MRHPYAIICTFFLFVALIVQPVAARAQATLENPQPGSSQSGIGLISGWICQATQVDIELDGRATFQAAYGTGRGDTQVQCGDSNNGFGLLFNWNLLGDGVHRVRVLADGIEVASSTFTVTTLELGAFPQGLSGTGTITDFPQVGRSTRLQWQESGQNFVIVNPSGNSNGEGRNSPGAQLENPRPGSSQSGIGLISGWICQANRVDIELDGRATFQAAYGTGRGDTQEPCGDTNNGFGLLVNWNLLGDGTNHRMRVLADGVEVANATFSVTTLGLGEFPVGLSGTTTIANFPQAGRSTHLRWQESGQNFVITGGIDSLLLSVSSTTLNFGTVMVNSNTDSTFTVMNSGKGTLTGSVSTSAPFSIVSNGTFSLAAGESKSVTVRFAPATAGPFTGSATIFSNGGTQTVSLSGMVVLPEVPQLELLSDSLSFGTVTIGLSGSRSFTIRNSGGGTLMGSVSTSAPFSIVSNGTFSLAARQSQTVTVQFSPTIIGPVSGIVTINSNGGSGNVAVSGVGEQGPQVVVNPNRLQFADVPVGQSQTKTFDVTNSGGGMLTGSVSASAPFSVESGGTFSLGAGQRQTTTIRFSPTAWGPASGNVAVTSNATNGNPQVALSGTGTNPPPPMPPHTLTVTLTGDVGGKVTSSPAGITCGADCEESYPQGMVVTLTATGAFVDHYNVYFGHWEGDCSGGGTQSTVQVTMTANINCTAVFTIFPPTNKVTLTVSLVGSGSAAVSGGFSCKGEVPRTCSRVYDQYVIVPLSTVESLSTFSSWGGDCSSCGVTPTCEVFMTHDLSCTVSFY